MLMKQSICQKNMSIGIVSMNGLLNILEMRPTTLLLTITKISSDELDEYGFIKLPPRQRVGTRHRFKALPSANYGCRGYCVHLPHADSRRISYKKTGEYYCARCEKSMRCARCRCCGTLGRMEPRQRRRLKHPETKFVDAHDEVEQTQ